MMCDNKLSHQQIDHQQIDHQPYLTSVVKNDAAVDDILMSMTYHNNAIIILHDLSLISKTPRVKDTCQVSYRISHVQVRMIYSQ